MLAWLQWEELGCTWFQRRGCQFSGLPHPRWRAPPLTRWPRCISTPRDRRSPAASVRAGGCGLESTCGSTYYKRARVKTFYLGGNRNILTYSIRGTYTVLPNELTRGVTYRPQDEEVQPAHVVHWCWRCKRGLHNTLRIGRRDINGVWLNHLCLRPYQNPP